MILRELILNLWPWYFSARHMMWGYVNPSTRLQNINVSLFVKMTFNDRPKSRESKQKSVKQNSNLK